MKKKKENKESIKSILKKGLDELFDAFQYQRFLELIARLPHYSFRNILLILNQCPHASDTRVFKGWLKVKRIPGAGEKGIRIIAPFIEKKEEEEEEQEVEDFRCICVFDVSQTVPLEGYEDNEVAPVQQYYTLAPSNGDVDGYDDLMDLLRSVSPYALRFVPMADTDKRKFGRCDHQNRLVVLRTAMSQIRTIRAAIHYIVHAVKHSSDIDATDELVADSVSYIICRHLGLKPSDQNFDYVSALSSDMEQKEVKELLISIQKTAAYIIDSISGVREARQIGYDNEELTLINNRKTVMRLYRQGNPIYLVFPGQGELFAMQMQAVKEHEGPYAVENAIWRDFERVA